MIIAHSLSLFEILPNYTNQNTCKASDEGGADLICHISGKINRNKFEDYITESYLRKHNIELRIGVDEAGRGPLLGSVVIGAVILPPEYSGELECIDLAQSPLAKLNDSKKISEKKRDELYAIIPSVALGYVSVDIPAAIIDEINILQASLQGMRIAVNALMKNLATALQKDIKNLSLELLFDGNKLPPFTDMDYKDWQSWGFDTSRVSSQAVVKGDSKFTSIASASVIAKVERDKQMYEMAESYPDYGIDSHKGYPTKAHIKSIEEYGVLAEHRRSFAPIKKALDL